MKLFIFKILYKLEYVFFNRIEGICYYMYCVYVEVLENFNFLFNIYICIYDEFII